jgi:hypothetical protein
MIDPAWRPTLDFVADFGDVAAIVPAFAAAAAALCLMGRGRDAVAWGGALLCAIVLTAWLKAASSGVEPWFAKHHLAIAALPSGHAVLGSTFYGGLGALLLYGCRSWFGRAAAVLAAGVQTAIIASVYLLGWHPLLDLLAGIGLGALAVLCLERWRSPAPLAPAQAARLIAVLLVALGLCHGLRYDDKRGILLIPAAQAHSL